MIKDKKLKKLVKKYFKECITQEKLSEVKALKLALAFKKLPKLQAVRATAFLLDEIKAYNLKTTLTVQASEKLEATLLSKIASKFKKDFMITKVTQETVPSLLGGVKVRIGDVLFDNSVSGRLQQVKEVIAHG